MLQPNRAKRACPLMGMAWFLGVLALSTYVGCDRTAELAEKDREPQRVGKLVATPNDSVDPSAISWLEKSAAAYARATTYQDAGRVVLSYKFDGKPTQDIAPLAVAYESPNRIGLKAYQVLAGSTPNRFRLKVQSQGAPTALSKQIISRELPKQLTMPWLLTDQIAVGHWAAGLAGSPPQMELLLGKEPYRALLDGATSVALDGEGTDGGQACKIVKIARGDARYRLWISATSALLRRIELPTATLPPAMLSDGHIAEIRLSIEFDDAKVGAPVDWAKWEVPVQPLDQLVRYLVAPPMTSVDPKLGKALPAFRLPASETGQMGWDTSAAAGIGKVQVLIWLADHPSCRATLDQLNAALQRVPAPMRERIAPVVVWAEASPPEGMTFSTLKKQWQMDMPVVLDDGEIGRDILAITEAPALMVLDGKHRLQFMQQRGNPMLADLLPDMLNRLVKGENLAQAALDQIELQQERFIAGLWQARASDCVVGAFTKPTIYETGFVKLEEVSVVPIKQAVVGFQADALRNLWLLRADGKLLQMNPSGKVEQELPSGFDMASRKPGRQDTVRIAIDEPAKFVALSARRGDRLVIVEPVTQRSSVVQLSNQSLTDFRWLDTPSGVRLAAITRNGKTLLVDPSRFEQHSGQSNQVPLAILPRVAEEALTSGYVILNDGRIEPVIVQDEGGAKATTLGQPASAPVTNKDRLGQNQDAVHNILKQLQFAPAGGPWIQWRDQKHTLTLAKGWLASDEPAVYVLDDKLQQMWHAPLAIQEGAEICGASVAMDPTSNQPLWVVATDASTLHFFRADGQLVDDCRLTGEICGVALVPMGQELRLWVALQDKLVQYRIQPR